MFRNLFDLFVNASLVGLVLIGVEISHATADIVVISSSRSIGAAATGTASDGSSTMLPGSFIDDVMVLGMSPAGTIGSSALQASTVPSMPAPLLGGIGSADVFAAATGMTGFSNTAFSDFATVFTVTTSAFYRLDAVVDWTGATPPPYGGAATVALTDLDSMTLIDSVFSTPASPAVDEIHGFYFLTSGVTYELVAEVGIAGGFATPGEYSASGSWSFTLSIPEPASFAPLALGLFALSVSRRR